MKKILSILLLLLTISAYGQTLYKSTAVQELGYDFNAKKWVIYYTWTDKQVDIVVDTDYIKIHTTKDITLKIDLKTATKLKGDDFIGIHYPAFDVADLKECDVFIVKYNNKKTIVSLLYREDLVQFKFLIE